MAQDSRMPTARSRGSRNRAASAEERRQAILDAALAEFAEHGFAAARLDDVARRAGVAKGTIYLLAKDKQNLLEQVVLRALAPLLERLTPPPHSARASREEFRALLDFFQQEVMQTNRKRVAQIILREGGRFPEIAEFWHREVISKVLAYVADAVSRAARDGLLRSPAYARRPQLVMAPMLLALVWDSHFSRFAPLDVAGLLDAHFEALFGADAARETPT
jgi:AcrR family transcriptional regulator